MSLELLLKYKRSLVIPDSVTMYLSLLKYLRRILVTTLYLTILGLGYGPTPALHSPLE